MPKRWLWFALMLGAYLTLRGYQSRDVDQAFRLPLLLHQQDNALFATDPFVRAFDVFNPHKGYLFLLGVVGRCLGLSMAILVLYVFMFGLTVVGIDRLTRSVWQAKPDSVGLLAVLLVLVARAGNIGTNHLFDNELLDRLFALSLGWMALSSTIDRPTHGFFPSLCLGLAAIIHPSLGLQLACVFGLSWIVWDLCLSSGHPMAWKRLEKYTLLALALIPCLTIMSGQSGRLLEGLPRDELWQLSVELQSPQHMLPHLWRLPQWLAWFGYIALAMVALAEKGWNPARVRLVTMLGVVVVGLGLATLGIEVLRDLRLTMFQPFRMATWARGLALVLVAERVHTLWSRGDIGGRTRGLLIVVGLLGDWMFVVAAGVELAATFGETLARRYFRNWGSSQHFEPISVVPQPHLSPSEPRTDQANRPWVEPQVRADPPSLERASRSGPGLRLRPTSRQRSLSLVAPRLTVSQLASRAAVPDQAWLDQQTLRWGNILGLCTLAVGLVYLYRHDTQQGQWALLTAVIASLVLRSLRRWTPAWNRRRVCLAFGMVWIVPLMALIVPPMLGVESNSPVVRVLASRCRFWAVPLDDVERLAVWARAETPPDAIFIGPPGPKAFRLWSQRALAFNRAGSPYHAAGLDEWARRFKRHVGFSGTNQAFAKAYQSQRHALESGFDRLTNRQLVDLAQEENASFVLASSTRQSGDGLQEIKSVGSYSLFRLDARR